MAEETTQPKALEIPQVITVGEFAGRLDLPATKVIGELMRNGVMASINEQIDYDTAAIIAADLGFDNVAPEVTAEDAIKAARQPLAEGEGETRPPIVAVMGHVDHGKTSLLDAIRQTSVAEGEAGGITQHIGAYQVKRNDRWITFLDTPGHEAFSAIRAHGAKMTDVAIIVVAADDGVKPQTKEAIKHAKDAGVQIVVAINKIDKEGADVTRVKSELSELGLMAEDWGGDVVMVEISAKEKTGIEALLDVVLLVVDLQELKARVDGMADGVIIESHLDTGRGPVATVLIQSGTLHVGDAIVAGGTYAKVRNLEDYRGRRIKQATPGMPAVVTGFKAVPDFGHMFVQVADEKIAKEQASASRRHSSIKSMVVKKIGVEELTSAITAGETDELNVVVKADVQGSLESLLESLASLRNSEVGVKVVSSGVGDVSESDVANAAATGALVLGFNVSTSSAVKQLANREKVNIQLYRVIYELLDDLRAILSQMLKPETIETEQATLKVLGVFKTTKTKVICGGEVTSGKITNDLDLRIMRGKEVIGEGKITNLQKDKQESKEVVQGEQCGMSVETTTAIEVDDVLSFYTSEQRARTFEA
jgi:translation initiation factor IF-2